MPDLQFGMSVAPVWQEQSEIFDLVRAAEDTGLDLVGIQDHPYQWRFYDTWTLISFLAGMTSRIRFFPDVISLPLRPPAILAKSAASLDVLSGGRVELGLGAGTFWEAVGAMGGKVRSPGEAVAAIEEAIDVIRLVWSGDRGVKYDGEHYQLAGMHTGPQPAHDMAIWVGARGPRMLDLIGRKADGWVPSSSWAPPEDLPGYLAKIEGAASSAGREAESIRTIYNLNGSIGDAGGEPFRGPVDQWVDDLVEVAGLGVDTFIFWPEGDDRADQIRGFATEVAPRVRSAVAG